MIVPLGQLAHEVPDLHLRTLLVVAIAAGSGRLENAQMSRVIWKTDTSRSDMYVEMSAHGSGRWVRQPT
jgi:hypothetical protein